ncbi:MAG: hypothetical protein K5644_09750, partial [Lachnospiraceae bacterium]|nr:hypothetical protein [Lachnospiraceae bacterium]
MILTNRFNAEYNFDLIDRDFDIFLVEKPESLKKTNILDQATEQFKARAVQYDFGYKALVLFDKGDISEKKFKEAVQNEHPEAIVKRLDILNEDVRSNNFYYQNRLLLQLLVNSIRVPRDEEFSYNNLTGEMFYGNPKWREKDKITKEPYSVYFLQISFDPGMYLNLDVKTFKKSKYSKTGRFYIFDPKTGYFRKKLKEDDVKADDLFVDNAFSKNHNNVNYLDFGTYEKFRRSKLGVMEQFLRDVNKYLGQYVILTAQKRTDYQCYVEKKNDRDTLSEKDCGDFLNKLGVNIVDECRTKDSEKIRQTIVDELKNCYKIDPSIGELDESAYNIRIIHNREYYENNQVADPHNEDLQGFIVQHVMQEEYMDFLKDPKKKEAPVIRKMVTELILKGDIQSRQVSIYDWGKLSSNKTWTFVQRKKIKSPNGGFESIVNAAGKESRH